MAPPSMAMQDDEINRCAMVQPLCMACGHRMMGIQTHHALEEKIPMKSLQFSIQINGKTIKKTFDHSWLHLAHEISP